MALVTGAVTGAGEAGVDGLVVGVVVLVVGAGGVTAWVAVPSSPPTGSVVDDGVVVADVEGEVRSERAPPREAAPAGAARHVPKRSIKPNIPNTASAL